MATTRCGGGRGCGICPWICLALSANILRSMATIVKPHTKRWRNKIGGGGVQASRRTFDARYHSCRGGGCGQAASDRAHCGLDLDWRQPNCGRESHEEIERCKQATKMFGPAIIRAAESLKHDSTHVQWTLRQCAQSRRSQPGEVAFRHAQPVESR